MTREEAESVHLAHKTFEESPTAENAKKLFELLNKYKMFMTTVRLFYEHDLDTKRSQRSDYVAMRKEYEFARDRLKLYAEANPDAMPDGVKVELDPRKKTFMRRQFSLALFFFFLVVLTWNEAKKSGQDLKSFLKFSNNGF